jgi:hypothetical protein
MMGGTMDGGGNDGDSMPPPEDAPATTDTLTAGGGSDNDDDDEGNDDDSGGSQDNDDDNDKGKDNDNDNEPTSEDAPLTTDTLTAKKIECPTGQEVTLFSTTCEPAGGGADGTEGATSAATVCPTSPTPTSYGIPDELPVTNAVWGFTNNHEIKTQQHDTQQTLLRQVATPIKPGVKLDPGLAAVCTGEPVVENNPDGTVTTHDPDGTKSIASFSEGSVTKVNKIDADGNLISSTQHDPDTGIKLKITEYGNGLITITTNNPVDGKPVVKDEIDAVTREGTRSTGYHPITSQPLYIHEYGLVGPLKTTIYTNDGGRIEVVPTSGVETKETTYDKNGNIVKESAGKIATVGKRFNIPYE